MLCFERCCAFLLVPGVFQTVQLTEFWGAVVVALQAYFTGLVILGIDNRNVVRSIGC